MNPLRTAFRQLLSGWLLLTLGVTLSLPLLSTNTAGQFQAPGGAEVSVAGVRYSSLPPDFGRALPAMPMAVTTGDDDIEVDEDSTATTLVGGARSGLANDIFDGPGPLTVVNNTDPVSGTLTLNSDGTFSYDPNGEFEYLAVGESANDSFTYTASDGTPDTDTGTVTLTINGVNDPPVAGDDGGAGFTTNEDTAFTTANVLPNDDDPDTSDVLSVSALITTTTTGLVTNNGNGSFNYNPNGQFEDLAVGESTTDSFSYTVSDGHGGTDTATVTVTINGVNDLPTAADDSGTDFTTNEDTAFTTANVLQNDDDPDTSDVLSISAVVTTTTTGLVTDNGNGFFNYNPNGQFEDLAVGESTTDSFSYTVSDGHGGSDTATVTITINGVNDTPTANNNGGTGFTTNEDTAFTTANVLPNDTDPDTSDVLSVSAMDTTGTTGLVMDNGNGTFNYNPNGLFEDLAVGESTTDSFDYTASDGHGGTSSATVTITINGVNDTPTANNNGGTGFTTNEDTAFTTANVLPNDTDPDTSDVLSVSAMDTTGTIGLVTNNGNGSFNYNPNGQFEYLAVGESTTDSFDYTASDGHGGSDTATVTITINGVNDAPVAANDNYEMKKGNTLEVAAPGVLLNDTDVDNTNLLVTAKTIIRNGTVTLNADGSFTYDPKDDFSGENVFNYQVCDPEDACVSAMVTIDVISNVLLTANADSATTKEDNAVVIDVLANDIDPDGNLDPNTLGISVQPSDGTATVGPGVGEITYDPDLNYFGQDEFRYIICDTIGGIAEDCKIAVVTVEVSSVNDTPVAVEDKYVIDEDEVLSIAAPGLLANDSDVETPSASLIAKLETSVARGVLELKPNGSFTYTPPEGFIGVVKFTYRASDGQLDSDVVTVTITVGEDVEAPTIAWMSPFIDAGGFADVGPQIFPLEVAVSDNVAVDVVNFRRWEPDIADWVYLGSVSSEPFRLLLDTGDLHLGFNQITAEAYDPSGNYSESYIFLKKWGGLAFLPAVSR